MLLERTIHCVGWGWLLLLHSWVMLAVAQTATALPPPLGEPRVQGAASQVGASLSHANEDEKIDAAKADVEEDQAEEPAEQEEPDEQAEPDEPDEVASEVPDAEYQRFELNLTLDAAKIQQLKKTGFLKATVPAQFFNRVDSIVLKQSDSFNDDRLSLPLDIDKRSRALFAEIDQSVLEHLPYQPVRIKVYESNFDAVVVQYRPGDGLIENQASTVNPETDSGLVWLQLNSGKKLPGYLRDGQSLILQSQIGDLPIPFDTFDGIGFLSATEDSVSNAAVLLLANGDQLSGQLEFETLRLCTRWGDKEFSRSEIVAITRAVQTTLTPPNKSDSSVWLIQRE